MKFLIDNALSPLVANALRSDGFDALHVRDIGLQDAPDAIIFNEADKENRVIVSADTDFSLILARRNAAKPSVILFRGEVSRIPSRQATILRENLESITSDLKKGAVVIFDGARVRIRLLPFT
jgi:predicted nuclease of predicted toxin-antitoxin system